MCSYLFGNCFSDNSMLFVRVHFSMIYPKTRNSWCIFTINRFRHSIHKPRFATGLHWKQTYCHTRSVVFKAPLKSVRLAEKVSMYVWPGPCSSSPPQSSPGCASFGSPSRQTALSQTWLCGTNVRPWSSYQCKNIKNNKQWVLIQWHWASRNQLNVLPEETFS